MKRPKRWVSFWLKYRFQVLLLLLILLAFGRWFGPGVIAFGDWYYQPAQRVAQYAFWPQFLEQAYGFPAYLSIGLPSTPLRAIIGFLYSLFNLDFAVTSIIVYYGFCLVVLVVGMWLLAKRITKSNLASFIAVSVYLFNSYILLIILGGQLLGGVAYAIMPLVLYLFDKLIEEKKRETALALALVLAVQTAYDMRYAFLGFGVLFLWLLAKVGFKFWKKEYLKALLPLLVVFLLLIAYWFYGVFFVTNDLGYVLEGYDNVGWVRTLSYSNWQHVVLLHHTWWPITEEAFKHQPNLIYLPIVLAALFGAKLAPKNYKKPLLFLTFITLVAIFLAKGSNPPYGGVYEWLFINIGPFKAYRDPSKFLFLVAFGYSILAASTVAWLQNQRKKIWKIIIAIGFITAIILPNLPLWKQDIKQTLAKQPVYNKVANYLRSVENYNDQNYRVLWYPRFYRFTDLTTKHPSLDGEVLAYGSWKSLPGLNQDIDRLAANRLFVFMLRTNGIRYVAVPGDPFNEIYRYADRPKEEFVKDLKEVEGLTFKDKIVDAKGEETFIFEVSGYLPSIYSADSLFVAQLAESPLIESQFNINENAVLSIVPNDQVFAKLNEVSTLSIQNPTTIKSKISEGLVSWEVFVSQDGDYELLLPDLSTPNVWYDWNGQRIDFINIQVNGDPFLSFQLSKQNSGRHKLTMHLDEQLTAEDSYLPDIVKNTSEWETCNSYVPLNIWGSIKKINGQAANFIADTASGYSICLEHEVETEKSKGFFALVTDASSASERARINTVYHPRYGDEFQLLKSGNKLQVFPIGTSQFYNNLVVRLKDDANIVSARTVVSKMFLVPISQNFSVHNGIILRNKEKTTHQKSEIYNVQNVNELKKTFSVKENKDGTFVVFNHAYDSNWQLISKKFNKIVDQHFAGNGQLNAWYLPPDYDGDFSIQYKPAKMLYLFSFVSLITLLAVFTYLILSYIKKVNINKIKHVWSRKTDS